MATPARSRMKPLLIGLGTCAYGSWLFLYFYDAICLFTSAPGEPGLDLHQFGPEANLTYVIFLTWAVMALALVACGLTVFTRRRVCLQIAVACSLLPLGCTAISIVYWLVLSFGEDFWLLEVMPMFATLWSACFLAILLLRRELKFLQGATISTSAASTFNPSAE